MGDRPGAIVCRTTGAMPSLSLLAVVRPEWRALRKPGISRPFGTWPAARFNGWSSIWVVIGGRFHFSPCHVALSTKPAPDSGGQQLAVRDGITVFSEVASYISKQINAAAPLLSFQFETGFTKSPN